MNPLSSCVYSLIFARDEIRDELSIQRGEAAENKWFFDHLALEKEAIETAFGSPLDWRRMGALKHVYRVSGEEGYLSIHVNPEEVKGHFVRDPEKVPLGRIVRCC